MKHNIRINGQIQTIDCELGSGILDKNGKEIFEGDKVKYGNKTFKMICSWGEGLSMCDYKNNCKDLQECMTRTFRNKGYALDVEVVGHVGD